MPREIPELPISRVDSTESLKPEKKPSLRRKTVVYRHGSIKEIEALTRSMSDYYPAETNTGVVTSWIPLASVWPSASGCRSSFRLDGPSLVAFDPGYGLDIDTAVVCQPPAVTTWWEQARLGGGGSDHTAVSILPLRCPESFSTVATSIKNQSSTLAMCCPS